MAGFGPRANRDIWWFFLLVLLGNSALVAFNLRRSNLAESQVQHTLRVMNAVDRLKINILDAGSSLRGYVATDQKSFVEMYDQTRPKIRPALAEVAALINDNEQQTSALQELSLLIDLRLQQFDELRAVHERVPRDPERVKDLIRQSGTVVTDLRNRIAELIAEEERQLIRRDRVAKEGMTVAWTTAITGTGLSLAVLALAWRLIRRDLTARERTAELLRQNEERFRAIAESLPQLVWVTAANGSAEYFNRRWLEYTGLNPDQSAGSGWTQALHAEDLEATKERWLECTRTGQLYEIEYRLRRADGIYRWFLARGTPIRDRAGKITHWFGTSTDVHDQKNAKEELTERVKERTAELEEVVQDLNREAAQRERTAAELARSNRELEQFAYVASHDLQEPLRKIQAFGDRLMQKCGEQLPDEGREYIERMKASAVRMRRLIEDLLTFSRVATRPMPFVDIDLAAVAADVVVDLEDALARTGGRIEIGPLPVIRADAVQMRQLLQNLLGNALKFHRPGLPPVVEVRADRIPRLPDTPPDQPDRPGVRIEVADNGIGFDETYRERIFQVFQRLHGRGEYEGTGIGLAVVRKIAERHGGSVTALGRPGQGATFVVHLPDNAEAVNPSLNGKFARLTI